MKFLVISLPSPREASGKFIDLVCSCSKGEVYTVLDNQSPDHTSGISNISEKQLVLLWAQLTKIYPPLPTSVQPISITKTLLPVPTKNERDPPLFTGKLLKKFQNIEKHYSSYRTT